MSTPFALNERIFIWERVDPEDQSLPWLRDQGLNLQLGRQNQDPTYLRYQEDDLIEDAAGCVGLMGSGGAQITRAVIEALPNLRVISKVGVGVDNIDVAAASERGIAVCHTPDDGDSVAVAEHAFALLIALCKQLHVWTPLMREGGWRNAKTFSARLDSRTVGIVGYGRIGRALAQRLTGWNVQILVHDPMVQYSPANVEVVSLENLLERSDAISLHCPALANGGPLLDAKAMARMRPNALLVNTARASLVDRDALISALQDGRLAGAAIDVFEPEPPTSNDALLHQPNVICTPHVASWSREGFFRRRQHAATNLVRQLRGDEGANVVNAETLT